MAHLDAFALKATGTQKTLAAPALAVWLSSPVAGTGRHVGLTGENPETRTTWIHVSDVGEWDGHQNGPFKLTREAFAQCVAALRACETPAMVDYDHASLRPLDGLPTLSAGYILDLEVRDDGLYALVELTKRAAAMVQAGEYRFCSGVFVWDAPDRATGEPIPCQLDSIGLTNKPFIDGQHAIRLSRRALGASMEIKKSELMSKLDALVSGATVTSDEIKALVDFLEKSSGNAEGEEESVEVELPAELSAPAPAALSAPLAVPPAAMADPMIAEVPVEVPAESVDGAAMVLTKLTELTGLDNVALLASIDANADAVKQAILGSAPAAALSADIKDQTIAALSREVHGYRVEAAKRAEAELAGEVDSLVKAGKALPSQRAQMLALAKASPTQFRALASTMPVIVPMGRDVPPEVPPTASAELAASEADTIPKTDARYVELAKVYEGAAWSRHLPRNPELRAAAIDRLVRADLKRAQPISG